VAEGVILPVFEHSDFFVFDKPEGVNFHSEDGAGFFVQLMQQYPAETLFPVHRLDKITSGLLLAARNKPAAQQFGAMFAAHAVQKTYLALADHKPAKKQGSVIGDMQRSRDGCWKLTRTRENPAITRFTSHLLTNDLRLFILKPQTGKTHQLRVMMKSQACPILGDERYGGTAADRGHLHAAALQFEWNNEAIQLALAPQSGQHFLAQAEAINSVYTCLRG
jgi:tRNA pseudouridine32 synthase/23S rRNA pseudouridine746 synthase